MGEVPCINMSDISPLNSVVTRLPAWNYVYPSETFQQLVQKSAMAGREQRWQPPAICSGPCNYTFTYGAPALQCRDIPSNEIWNGTSELTDGQVPSALLWRSDTELAMFNATTNMPQYTSESDLPDDRWYPLSSYDLTIVLLPHADSSNSTTDSRTPVGVTCTFWDAIYSVTTEFANNTQFTSLSIQQFNYPLSSGNCTEADVCTLSEDQIQDGNFSLSAYAMQAISSRSMVQSFVEMMQGALLYRGIILDAAYGTMASSTPLFRLRTQGSTWTFDLTVPPSDLSQGLVDLFADVTLGFLSASSDLSVSHNHTNNLAVRSVESTSSCLSGKMLTPVTFRPPYSLYAYEAWKLLLVYAVAFCFVGLGCAFGLWSMRQNGGPIRSNFSTFVETTLRSELDLGSLREKSTRLRYSHGPELMTGKGAWRMSEVGADE